MPSRYSDQSTELANLQAAKMEEAIANFKGRVVKCKPAMPKKKRNPVGGR